MAEADGGGIKGQIEMAIKTKLASDLFRQKWFRELKPEHKLLWLHLTLESNIVGVFEIDADSWAFFIGARVTAEDAFCRFGNRIQRIPGHGDKGIVVGKLDYQASFGKNSAQWRWVEKELEAVGLTYGKLCEMRTHEDEQLEFDFAADNPAKDTKPKNAEKDSRRIIPPKPEWIAEYVAANGYKVDAGRFFDFYESKGWKVGKNAMKDWQAAVRTWERDGEKKQARPAAAINQSLRRKF